MPPRGFPAYGRYPGFQNNYYGRGARRDPFQQHQQHFLRLGLVLLQQIASMERKPPVTIALVLVNVLFYLRPAGFEFVPTIREGCLQPNRIIKSWQWWRLLWAPLLHADDLHVFYNMSSLLWKGAQLEPILGALPFLRLIVELGLVSNLLYCGLAVLLAGRAPLLGRAVMSQCAVGFSGVLFGLKVVLNYNSPGWSQVYGVQLPTKYVCWAELVLAQMLVPGSSFWGHLCGIFAGILHMAVLRHVGPFAPGARVEVAGGERGRGGGSGGGRGTSRFWTYLFGGGRPPRTYGHGTWGAGTGGAGGVGGGYADQRRGFMG